ncbi:conserved hypothetical protein [Cupriavidus taiwanensis]|nr:conserved hypothetical protein [Cupriavidus taiwanensis]
MGEVCQIPSGLKCCLGQRQVLLRPNPTKVDGRFLLYALQSPYLQHQIGWNEGTGSTVSNLRIPVLEALRVPTPPLHVQREVAEILGAIDDRITLLRESNATLEAIAQALFKSWFVDFDPVRAKQEGREPEGMDEATAALFPDGFEESELGAMPRGWREGVFGDVAALVKGSVNPQDALQQEFEHYSLPAFDAHQLPALELGVSIRSNKTRICSGVVLQSKLNPHIPRVWLPLHVGAGAVCSTEFLPWLAKAPVSPEAVYCLLRSPAFGSAVRTLVTGTSNSHQRVKPDQVAELRTVVATAETYEAFTDAVRPLLRRVGENRQLCMQLGAIRDTLLPRLISGQLRMPEAEALAA